MLVKLTPVGLNSFLAVELNEQISVLQTSFEVTVRIFVERFNKFQLWKKSVMEWMKTFTICCFVLVKCTIPQSILVNFENANLQSNFSLEYSLD